MDKELLSIGEAAKFIGVSIMTLRRWDSAGTLKSFRPSSRSHRYYRKEELELFMNDLEALAKKWITTTIPEEPRGDFYCPTKDVFEARLVRLQNQLGKIPGFDDLSSLIVSAAGEIGNNSFDHNIGVWPDIPGIFFGYDPSKKSIVLADRGQGILETLKRVKSTLHTHQEALKTAFTEILSARTPEARGNGLKYVKKVITENPFTLLFCSGDAELYLFMGETHINVKIADSSLRGCLAILHY